MAKRGPTPKRSSQRRRVNKPEVPITKATGAPVVARPDPDPAWHPVAARWFSSLEGSGQSKFYEPSDWATAFVVAESMSREMHPQPMVVGRGVDARIEMVTLPPKGASMTAWLRAMTALLVTEGDRRRASLELERGGVGEEGAGVSELDAYRERLRSTI